MRNTTTVGHHSNQSVHVILNPMTGVVQQESQHCLSCHGWIPPSLSSLFSLVATTNYQGLSFVLLCLCTFVRQQTGGCQGRGKKGGTVHHLCQPSQDAALCCRRSGSVREVWNYCRVFHLKKNNQSYSGRTKPVYHSLVCFSSAFWISSGSTTRGWSMRTKTTVCWRSSALHIWCPARPKPTSPAWFTVTTAQVRKCVCLIAALAWIGFECMCEI